MYAHIIGDAGKTLYIYMPNELHFGIDFLEDTSAMRNLIINCKNDTVKFTTYNGNIKYDNICKSYLMSIWQYCGRCTNKKKQLMYDRRLNNVFGGKVNVNSGKDFQPITVESALNTDKSTYYIFLPDHDINKPIDSITDLIISKNLTINRKDIKEFLNTTLGEIFSNCFNHSDTNKAYYMNDIITENGKFYICVSIFDYGKTIINNVKEYYIRKYGKDISGKECMEWAIKEGNTTRKGSGGYGLPTILNYINEADGVLYIISGDTCLKCNDKGINIEKSIGSFPGTNVVFKLKLFDTSRMMRYSSKSKKIESINLLDI